MFGDLPEKRFKLKRTGALLCLERGQQDTDGQTFCCEYKGRNQNSLKHNWTWNKTKNDSPWLKHQVI